MAQQTVQAKTKKTKEIIIKMPYYQQISGSCWAACALMLTKAYAPYLGKEKEWEIYNFLNWMQRENDDYGLSHFFGEFTDKFTQTISSLLGEKVYSFYNSDEEALTNALSPLLQQGIPVILAWYSHAILLVGCRKSATATGNFPYDFLIHDPQGSYNPSFIDKEQGMYSWVSWQWILNKRALSAPGLYLLWINNKEPHKQRTLLTIGLPSGHFKTWNATGISVSRNFGIKFRISRSETIKFVWLPDSLHKKSFGWMKYLKDEPVDLVEEIPFDAYLLDLKLPLWNATFKNDVDVKLKGIIEQHENKNVVYEWEDTKTVPNNLAMEVYEKKIDLNKVRQVGSPLYKMKIIMEDTKGKYLDGWSIDFVMPHPYIDLIIPEQFSKNEKIQINGSSFGNEQKSNTTSANILINNVNADVIEWSNTRIIATAPDVASEGEVFVEIDVAPKGINAYKLQSNILNYSTNDEEIKVVDVQPQLVLSIRRKLTSKDKDYTSKIPSHYELYEFAEENNIKISGSVISIAYSNVVKKNVVVSMDTEVALPIQSKVEGKDDIKCYELPGGKMAKIVHKGAPWEAAPTLQKLSDWISKNNKKTTGPTRMVFLHNLFEETQPEKMLLEIYTPIE